MAIRHNARVTLTVTGHSDEDILRQIKNSLQLVEIERSNPEVPVPSEWDIRNKKLALVKFLRDFEKRYHPNGGVTGLIDLKHFVEDTFRI